MRVNEPDIEKCPDRGKIDDDKKDKRANEQFHLHCEFASPASVTVFHSSSAPCCATLLWYSLRSVVTETDCPVSDSPMPIKTPTITASAKPAVARDHRRAGRRVRPKGSTVESSTNLLSRNARLISILIS